MTATPLRTDDKLTVIAARMARAQPQLWDEFRKCMTDHAREALHRCVQAPSDQVIIEQGKARHAFELCVLFDHAVPTAEKLEAKMKERPNGR